MNKTLKVIAISTIFGLVAGIVGQLLSSAYISPDQILILNENNNQREIKETPVVNTPLDTYNKISSTLVDIYLINPTKPKSLHPLEQVYLNKDRVAQGVILTSDGWITSTGTISTEKNQYTVLTYDYKTYPVERVVEDKLTNTYFLKINAENLSVPELNDSKELNLGEKVIIPKINNEFDITEIQNVAYRLNAESKNLLISSEKPDRLILLGDEIKNAAPGTPLFSLSGEMIGLANKSNTITPTNYWNKAFLSLIEDDAIKRPYLGVNYIDLANSPGITHEFSQGKTAGALIWGIAKNSPALKTGLQDKDIILKVNSEEINQKHDLAEIINEYNPGTSLQLTVLRENEEITLEVELGEK